jgi:hypothetical protein
MKTGYLVFGIRSSLHAMAHKALGMWELHACFPRKSKVLGLLLIKMHMSMSNQSKPH